MIYYYTFETPSFVNFSSSLVVNANLNGENITNYTIPVQSISQVTDLFFAQNGIIISNLRPERNTRDPVSVIIQNQGTEGAHFYLEAIETFPNGTRAPINTNYGTVTIGNTKVMNQVFSIGALDSVTINFVWNVTGTSNIIGGNTISFFIVNITTFYNVPQSYSPKPESAYVYIIPRILLVDSEGAYFSSKNSVVSYYESFLQYTGYG